MYLFTVPIYLFMWLDTLYCRLQNLQDKTNKCFDDGISKGEILKFQGNEFS